MIDKANPKKIIKWSVEAWYIQVKCYMVISAKSIFGDYVFAFVPT